jgi:hypothetical protein
MATDSGDRQDAGRGRGQGTPRHPLDVGTRVRYVKIGLAADGIGGQEYYYTGTVSQVHIVEPLPLYNIYNDDSSFPVAVWHDEILEVLP